MDRLTLACALVALSGPAWAQSTYDPGQVSSGKPISAEYLTRFEASKADVAKPAITGGTLTGTELSKAYFNGAELDTVLSGYLSASSLPTTPINGQPVASLLGGAYGPQAGRTVFMGGLSGFPSLASGVASSISTGRIGLYEHANAMSALSFAQRAAIQAAWASTGASVVAGGGLGVGEIGSYPESQDSTAQGQLPYFGGAYPVETNMNYQNAGAGTGSYTAAAPDTKPGTVYGCYATSSDLAAMQTAIREAVKLGARNVGVVSTPNCGSEDLDDPFATAPFWANVRAAALYGGALTLDVPSTYATRVRGVTYTSFVAQMIRWGNAAGVRTSVIVSPYAVLADASGQVGGNGYDPVFLENTEALAATLYLAGAMPTQWVVENYATTNSADPNGPTGDGVAESINAVADFLATGLATTAPGTTAPGVPGGSAELNLLSDGSQVSLGVAPTTHPGGLLASDIRGLGDLATQSDVSVNLIGGMIGEPNTGALSIYLNGSSSFFAQTALGFQGGAGGNPTIGGGNDALIHLGVFAGAGPVGFSLGGTSLVATTTDPLGNPLLSASQDFQVVKTMFNGAGQVMFDASGLVRAPGGLLVGAPAAGAATSYTSVNVPSGYAADYFDIYLPGSTSALLQANTYGVKVYRQLTIGNSLVNSAGLAIVTTAGAIQGASGMALPYASAAVTSNTFTQTNIANVVYDGANNKLCVFPPGATTPKCATFQ